MNVADMSDARATESAQLPRVSRARFWIGWVLSLLPVPLLLMSAIMKLTLNPQAVQGFEHFGYARSLLRPLGITELSCALLYLFPRTSVLGAILLTGYLGGATATHVRLLDPMGCMPVLMGVVVWLGLLLREPRLDSLLPLRH